MHPCMRLRRHEVQSEVTLMECNPMMDLVALATVDGEVQVRELKEWRKVMSIPGEVTEKRLANVTALAWSPDGKTLAHAYDHGMIQFRKVDNQEDIFKHFVSSGVTTLSWIPCSLETTNSEPDPMYADSSSHFLLLNSPFEDHGAFERINRQTELFILVAGLDNGFLHFYSHSMYGLGVINLNADFKNPLHFRAISISASKDFRFLTVILAGKGNDGKLSYCYKTYSISLIYGCSKEIKIVSSKFSRISSILRILSSCLNVLHEKLNDVLLQINTKLDRYDNETTLGDDLLELLMLGNPSEYLQDFLCFNLKREGVEKLWQIVTKCSCDMQMMVTNAFASLTSSLIFYLHEIKGMSMWTEKFGRLGLEEFKVHQAITIAGSFMLKVYEFQIVLEDSSKHLMKFLDWLHGSVLRLIGEDSEKLTLEDFMFVSVFLKDYFATEENERKKKPVKLERCKQYFGKEDLTQPLLDLGNSWTEFLDKNPHMLKSGLIFPNCAGKSLVTLFQELSASVDGLQKTNSIDLHKTSTEHACFPLVKENYFKSPIKLSNIHCSRTGSLYSIFTIETPPCSSFYLIRNKFSDDGTVKIVGVTFTKLWDLPVLEHTISSKSTTRKIQDLKFTNEDLISVLLFEKDMEKKMSSMVLDIPVKLLCPYLRTQVTDELITLNSSLLDVSEILQWCSYKNLGKGKASQMAVGRPRENICVYVDSQMEVIHLEMEAEKEERG